MSAKTILVCGGAGYIGSHMARMLVEHGHAVTVFDNLSTGNRQALGWGEFVHGDLRREGDLADLFKARRFDAVFHFAALSVAPESVAEPARYYDHNVVGSCNLLRAMLRAGVDTFVLSSTAAVYGIPRTPKLAEDHPIAPENPYGRTKAVIEGMMEDFGAAYGLRSAALRYFNAAGAHPDGSMGEAHHPETHLIPNILASLLKPNRRLTVFGDTYPTRDGSCVRDYIHVQDLCRAHLAVLPLLEDRTGFNVFNLGNGEGYSVFEVIRAAEEATGERVRYEVEPPRPGDSPQLVADCSRAAQALGWRPELSDMRTIMETAWRWCRNRKY